MKTIIFKSEKKAKIYQVIAAIDFACYKAGEVLRSVKTDNIENCIKNGETYQEVIAN